MRPAARRHDGCRFTVGVEQPVVAAIGVGLQDAAPAGEMLRGMFELPRVLWRRFLSDLSG
ncbi:hypothetical protein predicted by Glimmer/Critica (plasmid) [Acetobacter ghanensis]|uniref:Uncharacterized protein n=1 Tax=Acetobacter ghanensis TaxID=431306 RepID=A0A0U5F7B5_9PROT|nr:hypothetical protein predicted by Glimmer/Critica [Acetobacter ghanensis]